MTTHQLILGLLIFGIGAALGLGVNHPGTSALGSYPRGQVVGWWWKKKQVLNAKDDAPVSAVGLDLVEELRNQMLAIKSGAMSGDGSKVAYSKLKQSTEFGKYKELVGQLKNLNLESLSLNQRKATLINLYNSLIVDAIINDLLDVNGGTLARLKLYASASYNIGGTLLSLNDIENGLLRCNKKSAVPFTSIPFRKEDDPRRKLMLPECDARIHFALNCAANGCPPIGVYSAADLDVQLNLATEGFLDGSVAMDPAANTITLSMLFSWYREDFGSSDEEVLRWIKQHASMELRAKLAESFPAAGAAAATTPKILYSPYDWSINSI